MSPYIYIIIPSYALLAVVGGIAAVCFVFTRLDRFEMKFSSFMILLGLCFIGGIIGSKTLYAVTQIGWLIENFSIVHLLLLIPQSGYVFYGGLFGVLLAVRVYSRDDSALRKRLYRMISPAIPLFHAFGRVGCFLAGCCYGKELAHPIMIGTVELTNIPVQLFEACAEGILFVVLVVFDRKKTDVDLLRIYLVCYAIIRFSDEFLRGDEIRGIWLGLATSQWISFGILLFFTVRALLGNGSKKDRLDLAVRNNRLTEGE